MSSSASMIFLWPVGSLLRLMNIFLCLDFYLEVWSLGTFLSRLSISRLWPLVDDRLSLWADSVASLCWYERRPSALRIDLRHSLSFGRSTLDVEVDDRRSSSRRSRRRFMRRHFGILHGTTSMHLSSGSLSRRLHIWFHRPETLK